MVDTLIPTIQETITAFVKSGIANALSLGQLCMDKGYSFRWDPGTLPIFLDPNGDNIPVTVRRYVPYLDNLGCGLAGAEGDRCVSDAHGVADAGDAPVGWWSNPGKRTEECDDKDDTSTQDPRVELEYVTDDSDDERACLSGRTDVISMEMVLSLLDMENEPNG